MCGIVAAFGGVDFRVLETFETMLSLITARGLDGTGIAVINKQMPIMKDTYLPLQLMRTNGYNKIMGDSVKIGSLGYIGHCRSATTGKVVKENAHPFQHKHITMVHNGTLMYDIKNGIETETDSESICIGIAERGIEDVWKELDGAASLVWWDAKKNNLNLISNGKRPLVFAYSEDKRTLFVASESHFIRKPVQVTGIKLKKDTVWKPNDDVLYTFRFSNSKVGESERKLQPKVFSYQSNYRGSSSYGGSSAASYADWWKQKESNADVFGREEDEYADTVIVCLDEETFNRSYKKCYFCNESLQGEWKTAKIVDDHIAVCEGCTAVAKANNIMLSSGALKGA